MRTRPTTLAIAICSAGAVGGIALSACSFALPEIAADATTIDLQFVPAGAFTPVDGREMLVPAWNIDAAIAAAVIADFDSRRTPPVVDYEHQTLRKEENGQPAPAAAWFRRLTWREGKGLYATVELTPRARDYIRSGEYKYFSPVFAYDTRNGNVTQVLMGAFTNNPAIHGMEPLTLQAAATFGAGRLDETHQEKSAMNKLLAAAIAVLCMSATATEDQAAAALTAIKPELDKLRTALGIAPDAKPEAVVAGIAAATAQVDQLAKLRDALAIPADAKPETALAACVAMKRNTTTDTTPDPEKFVPVSVVTELQTQVAALTASTVGREVNEIVEKALTEGRLMPAMKGWATDLGKSNLAALTAYVAAATPIAALTATQTQGRRPVDGDNELGLTHDEMAVCTATGIEPKAFAAAKPKAA